MNAQERELLKQTAWGVKMLLKQLFLDRHRIEGLTELVKSAEKAEKKLGEALRKFDEPVPALPDIPKTLLDYASQLDKALGILEVAVDPEKTLSEALNAEVRESPLSLRDQVLALIKDNGPMGYTTDELEQALSATHQSVSARVNQLKNQGLIKSAGRTRATRSGRQATVWNEVWR